MSTAKRSSIIKRRNRIHAVQKEKLVRLVQCHFIRTVGRHTNVNFELLNEGVWLKFADELNTLGPSKTGNEWKNTFYFMKNRVRNKAAKITQQNGNPKDHLPEAEHVILEMLPSNNHFDVQRALNDFLNENSNTANGNEYMDDGSSAIQDNEHNEMDCTEVQMDYIEVHRGGRGVTEWTGSDSLEIHSVETVGLLNMYSNTTNGNEFTDDGLSAVQENEQGDHNESTVVPEGGDSGTALVIHSVETMEPFDTEIAEEDDYYSAYIENPPTGSSGQDTRINLENCEHFFEFPLPPTADEFDEDLNATAFSSDNENFTGLQPAAKGVIRITETQKERLVQLLHNNYLKLLGRFSGANGAEIKSRLWKEIAAELNSLGPARTVVGWKAALNTLKASAKAKLADNHNVVEGTNKRFLTRLEEKIVAIFGMDALDGDQELGETGFQYEETVPNLTKKANPRDLELNENEFEHYPDDIEESRKEAVEGLNDRAEKGKNSRSTFGRKDSSIPQRTAASVNRFMNIDARVNDDQGSIDLANGASPFDYELYSGIRHRTPASVSRISGPLRENSIVDPFPTRRLASSGGPSSAKNVSAPRLRDSRNKSKVKRGPTVPRVRRSTANDEFNEITNINQLFNDDDDDIENDARGDNQRPTHSTIRQKRDRSNLRNRFTSYEMVQHSMRAQDQFMEQTNRNHAEAMFISERNHLETIRMHTSTLRELAEVAKEIIKKW